jgi:glycosyltransferase involved in cell wall biosynthesis
MGAAVNVVPGLRPLMRGLQPIEIFHLILDNLRAISLIRQIICQQQVHLVHSATAACWVGGIAARLAGVPSIYHVHDLTLAKPRWLEVIFGFVMALTADRVICVSEAALRAMPLRSLIGRKAIVVYNAVNTEEFYPNPVRGQNIRGELGISPTAPLVASFGSLDERKGQDVLIQAVARVIEQFPEACFLIVGGESLNAKRRGYGQRLRQLVADKGLSQWVKLLGARLDVPDLMHAVDLVVQPSFIEAGPLVPLEAMAAGVPVVATNVGGNSEEIVDGITGILVPPGDPLALADAIIQLLRDDKRKRSMGEAARVRVKAYFELSQQAQKIASLYLSLLK